jgi:NitT/TauT family transport system permease protein
MSSVPAEREATDPVAVQGGGGGDSDGGDGGASRARGRLLRLVLPAITLAVLLAAWQAGLVHKLLGLQPYTLAYPSDIVSTLRTQTGTLLPETMTTLLAAAAGFAIGSATGFALAILLAELDILRRTLLPMLSGLVSMPIIALAPLMVLYFGLGISSKIAVAAIMTAAPMAVTAYKGLNSFDSDSADLLRSYAAGRLRFWFDLKLPISLPYVFTALKLNVNLSLIGVIIAEFFGGRHGLGRQMKYAIETFDMPTAWTTIVIAAVMGILWYHLVGGVERLVVPWDRSLRGHGD